MSEKKYICVMFPYPSGDGLHFDIFRTEPIYNENLNQFVFISDEDIEHIELMSNFNQYHITYFKKIPIKTISSNN